MPWKRRGHRRVADLLVQAINARAYADMRPLLTDDFIYLDTMSAAIAGPDAFIDAMRLFYERVPDLRIEVDGYSSVAAALLIKGRIVSQDPEYNAESLWRAEFRGECMSELQAFRERNAASLPQIVKRGHGKQAEISAGPAQRPRIAE